MKGIFKPIEKEKTVSMDNIDNIDKNLLNSEELWNNTENKLLLHSLEKEENMVHLPDNIGVDDTTPANVNGNGYTPSSSSNCPCRTCIAEADNNSYLNMIEQPNQKSCACHYCNVSPTVSQPGGQLGVVGQLPPLTLPQLSLYPHIHGTSSDLLTAPSYDHLSTIRTPSVNSNPSFPSSYLGSERLNNQYARQWELPQRALPIPGQKSFLKNHDALLREEPPLVNGLQNLTLESSPSRLKISSYMSSAGSSVPSTVTTLNNTLVSISSTQGEMYSGVNSSCCRINGNPGVITHTKDTIQPIPVSDMAHRNHLLNKHMDDADLNVSDMAHTNHLLNKHLDEADLNGADYSGDSDPGDRDDECSGHSSECGGSCEDDSKRSSDCDCCYCHLMETKGGGRQRYSDRRERLLRILAQKKQEKPEVSETKIPHKGEEQNIEELLDYITGTSEKTTKRSKKTRKPTGEKKVIEKEKEREKEVTPAPEPLRKPPHKHKPVVVPKAEEEEEEEEEEYEEEEEEEEEEEDGPLAELRRRAPDVTITVVKSGQSKQEKEIGAPLVTMPKEPKQEQRRPPVIPRQKSTDTWTPPTQIPPHFMPSLAMQGGNPFPFENQAPAPPPPMMDPSMQQRRPPAPNNPPIDKILKSLKPNNKAKTKDDGSQMVTIRRVVDPTNPEPTVTITLKGDEKKNEQLLLKLVNGQAVPGQKNKQEHYEIPEGLTKEDAQLYKKKLKKERRKKEKEDELKQAAEEERRKQLELQKKQEMLKEQEKQIRQQQEALLRQQEELRRSSQQNKNNNQKITNGGGKNQKKGKQTKVKTKINKSNDDPKKPAQIADMSQNYSLPPGVSITKVAGQPGMLTISNTSGNQFAPPFLTNPNSYPAYSNNLNMGYPMGMGGIPNNFQNMYDSSNIPWTGSNSNNDSVIVVDAQNNDSNSKSSKKSGKGAPSVKNTNNKSCANGKSFANNKIATNSKSFANNNKTPANSKTAANNKSVAQPKPPPPVPKKTYTVSKKKFNAMNAEEKIAAAQRGDVDTKWLSLTLRKKMEKLKPKKPKPQEEAPKLTAEQREEDELMDRMYKISIGDYSDLKSLNKKKNKKEQGKQQQNNNQGKAQSGSKQSQQQPLKQSQQQPLKQTQKQKQAGVQEHSTKGKENKKSIPDSRSVQQNNRQPNNGGGKKVNKNNQAGNNPVNSSSLHNGSKKVQKKNGKGQQSDKKNFCQDDETDREVETFRRFCIDEYPSYSGVKPKVNFNVKDILIKRTH